MDLVEQKDFIIRLKKEQGYTAEDIAHHLNVSVDEVRGWLDFTQQNSVPSKNQIKMLMKAGESKPLSSLVFNNNEDALSRLENIHSEMIKDKSSGWADKIFAVINILKAG